MRKLSLNIETIIFKEKDWPKFYLILTGGVVDTADYKNFSKEAIKNDHIEMVELKVEKVEAYVP